MVIYQNMWTIHAFIFSEMENKQTKWAGLENILKSTNINQNQQFWQASDTADCGWAETPGQFGR